jgi:hypothetical protein
VAKIVKNARNLGTKYRSNDPCDFYNLLKVLPRDILCEFVLKTDHHFNDLTAITEEYHSMFNQYMHLFTPEDVIRLRKATRIPLLSYIEYFGKDHPLVKEEVINDFDQHRFNDGYFVSHRNDVQEIVDRWSMNEELRVMLINNEIPKWGYDRIFDADPDGEILKLMKESILSHGHYVDELNSTTILSGYYMFSLIRMNMEQNWNKLEVFEDMKRDWKNWRDERLANPRNLKIIMDSDEPFYINAAKQYGVTDEIFFEISISRDLPNDLEKIPKINSLMIKDDKIVDYYILNKLYFSPRYYGDKFDWPLNTIMDKIDYRAIVDKTINVLRQLETTMDRKK